MNEWLVARAAAVFMGASRRVAVHVDGWGDVQVQFSSGEVLPDIGKPLRLRVPIECARIYRR